MKNLKEIIASLIIAVSAVVLSGCSNINYVRFLFFDTETKEDLRKFQEISRNIEQGLPDYYSENNTIFPQSRGYQERIYSLPSEELNREIMSLYLKN